MTRNKAHWVALIVAIKRSFGFFLLSFILCWCFSDYIYNWLQKPSINVLPNKHLVSVSLIDTVIMPLHLAIWGGGFLLVPYIIFEIWLFVVPALNKFEKYFCLPLLMSAWLFFVLGFCFAYKIVFPLMFKFFVQHAPPNVIVMPDIMKYFDLCSTLLLVFGFSAQLPLVILVLNLLKVTNLKFWVKHRPHAILSAFVIGMILTPPDILSQILLAIPLILLYEIGVFLSKIFLHD